jgi:hypothetical protein
VVERGCDGEFGELIDAPYGLREFAFRDPEGTLLRVGSPIAASSIS